MEPLSSESIIIESFFICFYISIDFISDNWISYRCKMDSYLMSTSCHEIDLEECVFISNNSPIAKLCFSYFWIIWIKCCHSFAIIWISSDKRFNVSFFIFYDSYDQSKICFFDGSFCYLELESMHCFIIFCDENDPTCILIEAMYYTRTFDAIYYRWIFIFFIISSDSQGLEVIEKCIDECSFSSLFSWCRMGIDTSILIDNCEVIIFIDDIEWHIFCEKFHSLYFPSHFDHISSVDFLIFCEVLTIGEDIPLFDHFLEIASRLFRKKSR